MLKRMLAAGGLLGALLFVGAPNADAHVGFSFGIAVPGFTYYQSNVPPAYYPPADYYVPPARTYYGYGNYGYGYGGYGYDDGRRYRHSDRRWHRHRGCDR